MLSCCTHMPFDLDRISVYILHTAWPESSEEAFVLPQWIVLRISDVDALILQELSNKRNIHTYLPTYVHICVCVCVHDISRWSSILQRFNDTRQIHSLITYALSIEIDLNVITKTNLVSIQYHFSESLHEYALRLKISGNFAMIISQLPIKYFQFR